MTATKTGKQKHRPGSTGRARLLALSVSGCVAVGMLAVTTLAFARPRPPLPPFPDFGLLNAWRFDDTNSWGGADSAPLVAQGVELAESWSGYVLRIAGGKTAQVRFPAFKGNGRPNLRCDSGSIRFWFSPNWSSADCGGKGPGSYARLIEVGTASRQADGWWSLYVDPVKGSVLTIDTGKVVTHLRER